MNPENFRHSIRRSIAIRVGLTALLLGSIFAGIAAIAERERMEGEVVALAHTTASRWNASIREQLDQAGSLLPGALQDSLDKYIAGRGDHAPEQGRFIIARVNRSDGLQLAQLEDTNFANLTEIRKAVDAAGFRPSESGDHPVVSVRLDGHPYVAVQIALTDSRGDDRAWLGGVFALSKAEQARLQANILRTILYVFAVILITGLVLYPIISRLLDRLSGLADHLLDANLETLQVLGGAIAKRDSDTDAHNYRVTVYSIRLAEAAGLDDSQIQALIKGALLHDIGKLGIRDSVLLKPGRLDEAEFAIMKTHVEHGLDITGRAHWLADAREIVGAHHEKFGGGGYPGGLVGESIPLSARIFAIADVFDALTSRRPYKEPFSFDATMKIMKQGRGEHFDPHLLELFEGLARDIYDRFGGRDGDEARDELNRLMKQFFRRDTATVMRSPGKGRSITVDNPS